MALKSEAPTTRPRLALLLGDMTGIGPELVARVMSDRRLADVARIVVLGDVRVLEMGARDAGVPLAVNRVTDVNSIDWDAPAHPSWISATSILRHSLAPSCRRSPAN